MRRVQFLVLFSFRELLFRTPHPCAPSPSRPSTATRRVIVLIYHIYRFLNNYLSASRHNRFTFSPSIEPWLPSSLVSFGFHDIHDSSTSHKIRFRGACCCARYCRTTLNCCHHPCFCCSWTLQRDDIVCVEQFFSRLRRLGCLDQGPRKTLGHTGDAGERGGLRRCVCACGLGVCTTICLVCVCLSVLQMLGTRGARFYHRVFSARVSTRRHHNEGYYSVQRTTVPISTAAACTELQGWRCGRRRCGVIRRAGFAQRLEDRIVHP